jgi:lysophospholipase L1-like esterase
MTTPLSPLGEQELATQRAQALTPWFAGLSDRDYARCNVVCLGDSITEGQGAVGPPFTGFEDRWLARLRDMLRSRYPTAGLTGGGRGFIGAADTGETSFPWPAVLAGTPPTVAQGPKGTGIQLNAAGQSITYNLTGDSADIMWVQVPFGGTFSYAIGGGSAVNVSTNGALADGKVTHVSLGAAGPHVLTLRWVSGNLDIDGVTEYNGDYSAGIQVHDAGHYGWATGTWQTATASGSAGAAGAIAALAPSLLIIMLGVNDQFSGVSPTTLQSNLQAIIASLKAVLPSPCSAFALCMLPPRVNQSSYAFPWSQYVTAAWNVAAADTSGPSGTSIVTVMDFTLGNRMPGADTDVYGFWHAGDLVHPSDRGDQMIADALAQFLSEG